MPKQVKITHVRLTQTQEQRMMRLYGKLESLRMANEEQQTQTSAPAKHDPDKTRVINVAPRI